MTVQTTTNKAGPFAGNNVVTQFSTTFRVDGANDLQVIYTDTTGIDIILSQSVYSVSGYGADTGITVTYPLNGGGAIGPLERITLLRTVSNTQATSITNQGGFYPKVIENALDRIVFQCQQLAEKLTRAVSTGLKHARPVRGVQFDLDQCGCGSGERGQCQYRLVDFSQPISRCFRRRSGAR